MPCYDHSRHAGVTWRIFRNITGNAWAPARVNFYSGEVSSTLRNRFTTTDVGKFSMTLTICHVVACHRNVGHWNMGHRNRRRVI